MNKHTAELFSRLAILGFSVAESVTLRRCEMTLKRWAERECGDGSDWAIERAEPVDLQLINWPDINGPVWLVENRPGGIFPVRRFETTDLRDPKANRILARERRLNVAGKPFNVYHGAGKSWRYAIADREAGALRRAKAIVDARNALLGLTKRHKAHMSIHHQGDCRGCMLYLVRRSDVPHGGNVESYYSRGFAVC